MISARSRYSGSARVPRAGFAVPAKQSFLAARASEETLRLRKVREGEDAFASTRDACATRMLESHAI